MAGTSERHEYPAGTGWAVGYAVGVVFGAIAWWYSGAFVYAVVAIAAIGPALGLGLEASLDTRPVTARRRRTLLALALAGIAVALLVFADDAFVA